MQFLLRKYTQDNQGDAQLIDVELADDNITLGSSPDSDIQLLGEKIIALHATIQKAKQTITMQASRGCDFVHNGKAVKEAELRLGDRLLIGQHKFKVIAPPPGFDIAMQWEPAEVDGSLLANAYRTDLGQTGLQPRRTSWLLALLVLVLAGLVPVADYFWRSSSSSAQQHISQQITPQSFWTSGPLHSAHRVALGNQCEACHQQAFEQVTDKACVACHSEPTDHIFKGHEHAAMLEGLACQSCHKEHNEPAQLTSHHDALCTNCHQALDPKISGFTPANHPEFQLSLLRPNIVRSIGSFTQNWTIERKSVALDNRENSHLKFSHQVHLDSSKVQSQTSDEGLQCAQCHQLSADKEHFVPITMEQHCSSCHELSFDPDQPKKQLPHGVVETVYPALEAHFLNLAFNEGDAKQNLPPRRLPAKTPERQSCLGDFACAQAQAIAEADRQFSQKGCVTCHEIEQIEGADARSRWQVLPVKLASDWYPAAQFNHQSHLTQQGERDNALCLSCHKAEQSQHSEDVLLPGIDNCTSCHGDMSTSNKVELACVSCHAFHPTKLQLEAKQLSVGALIESLNTEQETTKTPDEPATPQPATAEAD